jgi:uncharacterized membrane protein
VARHGVAGEFATSDGTRARNLTTRQLTGKLTTARAGGLARILMTVTMIRVGHRPLRPPRHMAGARPGPLSPGSVAGGRILAQTAWQSTGTHAGRHGGSLRTVGGPRSARRVLAAESPGQ